MRKVVIAIVIMALGMALLAGCGNTQQNSKPAKNQMRVITGKIREVLSLDGDTQITVKRVIPNPEDNKMILLETEIKNISNAPKIYGTQNFTLTDSNGKVYQPEIAKVPNPIVTTNILPGKSMDGFLGFCVSGGENDFTLIFQGATGEIRVKFKAPKQ